MKNNNIKYDAKVFPINTLWTTAFWEVAMKNRLMRMGLLVLSLLILYGSGLMIWMLLVLQGH